MASLTWNKIAGQWKQLKGDVQQRWGDLTNDEVDLIKGDR
jgi:uncharacterized protein YjbJ (UPF0337 family)